MLSGMRYEQWGRPRNDRCDGFDDNSAVRKFNLETIFTNNTEEEFEFWTEETFVPRYPAFYANSGRELVACFYIHLGVIGAIPPEGALTITFAAFCNLDEYVAEMRFEAWPEFRRCFSPEGQEVGCP